MLGKIAVEEHYALPPVEAAANNAFREDYLADVQRRLSNRDARLEEMDANGIEYIPVSLTEPGVQGIPDPVEALDYARRCNDHVAEYYIGFNARRFGGLAAVPMQDPKAAAAELERVLVDKPYLAGDTDEAHLHVAFLSARPAQSRIAKLDPERSPPDTFEVVGREIYLHCPKGVARSKLTNAWFDSGLATTSTMRNWKTVRKLVELVQLTA